MIATQTQQASHVYTDVNALQGIRTLGKQDKNAALMEVAKQFESMFLNMMLSSMRDANQVFKEDSLFSSSESDFYQNMYDDQIALSLSTSQSTGLADVIYRQMLSNYGDLDRSEKPELKHDQLRQHDSSLKQIMRQVDDSVERINKTQNQTAATAADTAQLKPESSTENIAQGDGNKGQQFASADEFVAALYPHANQVAETLNVDAKAIIAQAALETGWGKYMISDQQGNNSFNFFGIKADQRWDGEKVTIQTHEYRSGVRVNEKAAFRSYDSIAAGLKDYAAFLQQGERYQQAIGKGLTGDQYGHALQQAGYATDPSYGAKIQRVSRSDTLNQALQQLTTPLRSDANQADPVSR